MLAAMRLSSGFLALTFALLLGGCDAVTSTAAKYNPFPSFETRCEQLPASQVEVRQQTIRPVTNDTLPYRELTGLGKENPATHRTLGLTKTEFRQEVALEVKGIADSGGGRSCSRPRIVIDLTMAPMTVYVASELANDACGHAAVLAHEMKHVAAFREHMADTARTLEADLPQLFGQRIIKARDADAGEAQVREALRAFLEEFITLNTQELKERNAAVDSAEEYARVNGACGGITVDAAPPVS
jgi:hypothetical protein